MRLILSDSPVAVIGDLTDIWQAFYQTGAFISTAYLAAGYNTYDAYVCGAGGGGGRGGAGYWVATNSQKHAGGGGGGGGCGELEIRRGLPLSGLAGSTTATVGGGGLAATQSVVAQAGATSSFAGISARGGGRGGNSLGATASRVSAGGSGGAGGSSTAVGAAGIDATSEIRVLGPAGTSGSGRGGDGGGYISSGGQARGTHGDDGVVVLQDLGAGVFSNFNNGSGGGGGGRGSTYISYPFHPENFWAGSGGWVDGRTGTKADRPSTINKVVDPGHIEYAGAGGGGGIGHDLNAIIGISGVVALYPPYLPGWGGDGGSGGLLLYGDSDGRYTPKLGTRGSNGIVLVRVYKV